MKKILLFAGLLLAAISVRAQDSRGVPSTSVQANNKDVMAWDGTGNTYNPLPLDSALIAQKAISLGDINVTGWTVGHMLTVGAGGVVYPVAPSAAAYNTAFAINGTNLRITDGGGNLDVPVISIAPVQSVVQGTGPVTVTSAAGVFTVNNTDPDILADNEGLLTVAAGTATNALIHSNTTGGTDVTIAVGNGLTITENTGTGVITLTQSNDGLTTVTGSTSAQANTNYGGAAGTKFLWDDGFSIHEMTKK